MTAQPGIFALGTAAHCYLELDARPGVARTDLLRAFASLDEPGASVGGANLVVGFRPELWSDAGLPPAGPADARGFGAPIVGPDGYTMPATQHDAWIWVSGAALDIVFDVALDMVDSVASVATVATEVTGWPYQRFRDLTGFVDGTENPKLAEAPGVAVVPDGQAGEGGSVVLIQQWRHLTSRWRRLGDHEQELVIGRTKPDSMELDEDVMPPTSHVSRTTVEVDGEEQDIFRRNTPYGGITDHGTMFVGFCNQQTTLQVMLERMAGVGDGVRDRLTEFAEPLTGAYYLIPPVEALLDLRPS